MTWQLFLGPVITALACRFIRNSRELINSYVLFGILKIKGSHVMNIHHTVSLHALQEGTRTCLIFIKLLDCIKFMCLLPLRLLRGNRIIEHSR